MNLSSWIRMRSRLLVHSQFRSDPIGAIARRLWWKLFAEHRPSLRFDTQYGFAVEGSPRDIGVGSLFYRGQYEWAELELWKNLMNKADLTVVDIGANIGIYSLVAAAHCRTLGLSGVRIFGFEPNPTECAKYRRNVELNDFQEVSVQQIAVSERAGACRMAVPPSGLGVFGHLLGDTELRSEHDTEVDVATVDLDGWCVSRGVHRIDLMKLDVEGHELQVLLGAERLLARRAIGALLMEVGHGQWRRAVGELKSHGYAVNMIGPDGGLREFDEGSMRGWCNVLARSPDNIGSSMHDRG